MIAAALSIQDPRERPADKQAQADQSHARFADDDSDFLALPEPVALPARAAARAVGQPVPQAAARPSTCTTCASASGRTSSASCARRPRSVGVTLNHDAGRAARRSTSRCCPGCSRTSGCATPARREYVGARGARFAIFPGSALAQAAARLGDGRRAGRDVAAVGAHGGADRPALGRAAGRAPRQAHATASRAGSAGAASVVATERVTLYGLPIVAGRTVAYGRIDPALVARAVHPPRAGRGRLGHAARVLRREPAAASRRSRRSRTARAGATSSSTTRRCSTSTTRGSRPTSSRARTSTAGGATRAAPTRAADVPARAAGRARRRERRRAAGRRRWKQGELDAAAAATASSRAPRTTA